MGVGNDIDVGIFITSCNTKHGSCFLFAHHTVSVFKFVLGGKTEKQVIEASINKIKGIHIYLVVHGIVNHAGKQLLNIDDALLIVGFGGDE